MGLTQSIQVFRKTAGCFPRRVAQSTVEYLRKLALQYALYRAGPRKGRLAEKLVKGCRSLLSEKRVQKLVEKAFKKACKKLAIRWFSKQPVVQT